MKITWPGHSCFTVESQGYRIVLGPYKNGTAPGSAPVRVETDQVRNQLAITHLGQ